MLGKEQSSIRSNHWYISKQTVRKAAPPPYRHPWYAENSACDNKTRMTARFLATHFFVPHQLIGRGGRRVFFEVGFHGPPVQPGPAGDFFVGAMAFVEQSAIIRQQCVRIE